MIETNFWCGVFILASFLLGLTGMVGISWFAIPILDTIEWFIGIKPDLVDFAKFLLFEKRINYAKSVISFPERFKREWKISRHHKLSLLEELTRLTLGLYILGTASVMMLSAIHQNSSWEKIGYLTIDLFCSAAILFMAYELFWVIVKKVTKHPLAPKVFNARF